MIQRLTGQVRTDHDQPLLLRTEMGAGHAGPSGRYDAWQEISFSLAWQLEILGVAAGSPAAVPGS